MYFTRMALLLFGCSAAVNAAPAGATALRLTNPQLVCEASENYCKVSLKVAYTYPPGTRVQSPVPVECVADVAIQEKHTETIEHYRKLTFATVSYGIIDEEVEVEVNPPIRATSVELKGIACSISQAT